MRKGKAITVACKRCSARMLKWDREISGSAPFKFEDICGACITKKEAAYYIRDIRRKPRKAKM